MKIKPTYVSLQTFLLLVFIALNSKFTFSQDVHFSQYNGSVINLNPAFTGFFDGDYRVNGILRSQWSSVPVPYRSFSIAGDARFKPKNMRSDCFGAGIMFNNDKSGDTYYGTNQLYLSGSYIHKINKDSTLLWTTGIMMGISSVGFNYSRMTFDDQYQNNSYSSSNGTGEGFAKNATTFGDFNFGTALQYAIKQRAFVQYGISYHHFTNPKISFQNNANIRIDAKLNNYLCVAYPIGATTDVIAEILYSHQGKYNEVIPGAQFKFHLDQKTNQAASVGLYYRAKDAVIARLGYQVKTLTTGVSYDVNTSKFIAATNRRGGFEIYVTYIFKKIIPFVPKTRVCPVYM
ncbi:MAG: PorP/SprF family type IX secretion system membrane protein [Bacteroidetes bacterium]|nr:PorP/SprF family type IX secretion system membrane protein [Bacteroidota bacterium]